MEDIDQHLFDLLRRDIEKNRLLLPSLPEVALRVRELTGRADCSAIELADSIACDPTISARLLKVANSASLRGHAEIKTIQAAITRLGMNLVRSLVTQLCILQVMNGSKDRDQTRAFVESGLRVGTIANVLAAGHQHLNAEQAMLAGLVHDLGKLPLSQYMSRIPMLVENPKLRLQVLLRMHTRIGAVLLEAWKFPEELIQVAAEHEDLQRNPGRLPDYTDLVIAANLEYYGTESGRYAGIDPHSIPAVVKVWPLDRAAARSRIEEQLQYTEVLFS